MELLLAGKSTYFAKPQSLLPIRRIMKRHGWFERSVARCWEVLEELFW